MVKLFEKAKVGPKGQIVIPVSMRRAFNIKPGTEVVLETEENKIVIERPAKNIVGQMEELNKKGKTISKIHSDKDYEDMLEERWKDLKFT